VKWQKGVNPAIKCKNNAPGFRQSRATRPLCYPDTPKKRRQSRIAQSQRRLIDALRERERPAKLQWTARQIQAIEAALPKRQALPLLELSKLLGLRKNQLVNLIYPLAKSARHC
jgi:hypothetical protein